MPIKFVERNLFNNRFGAEAFAHGCNCQGAMGAGIAIGFKERYPEMYEEYRRRCKARPREFNPGDVFLWREEGKTSVFNLATQENYWRSRATYEAIETVLNKMRAGADSESIRSIAVPRIGAGYGGLSWDQCKLIIERVFLDWSGGLFIYDKYNANETIPSL